MDNLTQLKQKIDEVQTKSLVANDMRAFIKLVLEVIKKSKDEFNTLSSESKQTIQQALDYIESEHSKLKDNVTQETSKAKKDFDVKLAELNKLVKELKSVKYKDGENGQDGDDGYTPIKGLDYFTEKEIKDIKEDVLKYIPEIKGEKIVLEINSLPLDEDKKIDAKHIKNLPTTNQVMGFRGISQVYHDETLIGLGTQSEPLKVANGVNAVWGQISGDIANQTDLTSNFLKLNQTTPQTTVGRFTFPSLTIDTNTLFVDEVNHRVGIGKTNPSVALDVVGTINSSTGNFTSSAIDIYLKQGANTVFRGVRASTAWSDTVDTQWFQVGNNNDYVAFTTQSGLPAKRMLFATNSFNINTSINNTAPIGLFDISNGPTKLFNVLTNGNVGIGTTGPGNLLHVRGNLTTAGTSVNVARFDGGTTVPAGGLVFTSYYTDATRLAGIQSMDRDGNSRGLLLNATGGNVGIGTTSPTNKLDVRGTTVNDSIRSAIGFDIFQVPDPTAPTGVVSSGGSVDDGAHWYGVTYTTDLGETHIKFSASQITTTTGNNTVTLTIPVSTDPRVTGRKIYRTRAGHALYQDSLLATITNNTQTTYVDTASDASLPVVQGAAYFRMNTTSKVITVNGTQAMSLDSNGTIVGFQAGNVNAIGGRTSIFGKNAGASLTSATDCSLFGENAGTRLTTGNQNNLFGYNAGLYLTTGSSNTSMGHDSLLYAGTSSSNNTTIGYFAGAGVDGSSLYSNNTFIGYNAGRYITTGNSNTSLGAISLYINSTGSLNVALGYASLYNNTTGGSNIAVGYSSLFSNISGLNNTALGYNSARYIANGTTGRTTGNNGLYLGNETKSSADGTDNEIVIGYNAIGQGSNTAVIGNSSLTALYVSGQVVPVKLGTAPTAIEGGIYYNTTDKHFYGYNGTTWKQLDN